MNNDEAYENEMSEYERKAKIKIDPKVLDEIRQAVLPETLALAAAYIEAKQLEETLPKFMDIPTNSVDTTKLSAEQKKAFEAANKKANDAYGRIDAAIAEKNQDRKWFDASTQEGKDSLEKAAHPLKRAAFAALVITLNDGYTRGTEPEERTAGQMLLDSIQSGPRRADGKDWSDALGDRTGRGKTKP